MEDVVTAHHIPLVVTVRDPARILAAARREIALHEEVVVRLVGRSVEVAGHEDGPVLAVLLPVELEEAQNLSDLPHANDAEVGLVREEEVRVDQDHLRLAVVRARRDLQPLQHRHAVPQVPEDDVSPIPHRDAVLDEGDKTVPAVSRALELRPTVFVSEVRFVHVHQIVVVDPKLLEADHIAVQRVQQLYDLLVALDVQLLVRALPRVLLPMHPPEQRAPNVERRHCDCPLSRPAARFRPRVQCPVPQRQRGAARQE
mmetsp:Transcript_107/g.271  ORF Transcript_107/g.271 Transcript_107/m.271 type:complete len:257 (+) Transcript_107:634-1404(+)